MKYCLGLGALFFLNGCVDEEWQSIEDYKLNNNIEQEQNNSSNYNWSDRAFSDRCGWFDLERTVDGDTIIVRDGQVRIRVRMIGIDTPESKKEGTAIQDYALEAGDKLSELLSGQEEVCLIDDEVGDKYDIYGRKLAYVFTSEGLDLNAEMLKIGLARGYFSFPFERKQEFKGYEHEARELNLGLWEN